MEPSPFPAAGLRDCEALDLAFGAVLHLQDHPEAAGGGNRAEFEAPAELEERLWGSATDLRHALSAHAATFPLPLRLLLGRQAILELLPHRFLENPSDFVVRAAVP